MTHTLIALLLGSSRARPLLTSSKCIRDSRLLPVKSNATTTQSLLVTLLLIPSGLSITDVLMSRLSPLPPTHNGHKSITLRCAQNSNRERESEGVCDPLNTALTQIFLAWPPPSTPQKDKISFQAVLLLLLPRAACRCSIVVSPVNHHGSPVPPLSWPIR